jgi:hypothetical protein
MPRIVGGLLALLLALPAAGAQDKDKGPDGPDKAATPAQQYQALLKEFNEQMRLYQQAVKGKTPEEQQKLYQEKYPKRDKLAPKFIALAEKNPTDPVAIDALLWVLGDPVSVQPLGGKDSRARAVELLIRDHIQSEKMAQACMSLGNRMDRGTEKLLRAVMEKNPHKNAQAEACLALAQNLSQRARLIKLAKENPGMAGQIENILGKEVYEELKNADLAKVNAQTAAVYTELVDKYLADMKTGRLTSLMQQLSFSGGDPSEALLRSILEKDKRHDVQGQACLYLGQAVKKRGDDLTTGDAKQIAKLHAEAEAILERAAKEFGDVKTFRNTTIADQVKRELFDLRNLAVGKSAPDVEAEDQDGRKFKLSDYKGKVVLLDFWSQF